MAFIQTVLHALLLGFDVTGALGGGPWSASLTLLALVAVGAALALMAVRGCVAPPFSDGDARVRRNAMRRRAGRGFAVVSRDPDAPGKTRPRAPGAAPVAA
ncbi:hypothetical protein HDA32_000159 [Spinactinospora alkalitolerans]|uniref:Uncharacterized protein n=1 Tax=Spinactinospora alkalitolerans TaxID=687207 RepID=A0A852TM57_9ACTN|nr:DUF6412 domain-containing protein [Spinactinospora alkalitolerans]NYE45039.1 hypothetical protein [Spinactinospora alkalitolerans]